MPFWRRLARALIWGGVSFGVFVLVIATGSALLGGRPVPLPLWAVAEAEARLNAAMSGDVSLVIGGADLKVDAGRVPQVAFYDLQVLGPGGTAIARLPELSVSFDTTGFLTGAVRAERIVLTGATLALRRDADGRYDIAFGDGFTSLGALSPATFLDALAAVLARPVFAALDAIAVEGMTVTLDDRKAGRLWTAGDGRLVIERRGDGVAVNAGFGLAGGTAAQAPARAQVTLFTEAGGDARLAIRVSDLAAPDLATLAPFLAWLEVIEAPLSGELRARFAPGGAVAGIEGALAFDGGALRPDPAALPIAIDRAAITFTFDPATQRIDFSDLAVESDTLRLGASGHSYLTEVTDGVPRAFLAQVQIDDLAVDPEATFVAPALFSDGAIDLRMRLDPFDIEIGQASLATTEGRLAASGRIGADASGWRVSLDLSLDAIGHRELLTLWPLALAPRTRAWVARNVQDGGLSNLRAAVRIVPDKPPILSLNYDFAGAEVRILPTLPPVQEGAGHATILGNVYTLVLDKGHVTPPQGGPIDVAGSVFTVPDITARPGMAEVALVTRSTITAALSLLDQPPFGFLSKAGLDVDLAGGEAETTARLTLPLVAPTPIAAVGFTVEGVLRNVASDRMAPGMVVTAPELRLVATPGGVTISGPGRIGEVPFDAVWRQPFGPDVGPSTLTGSVTLGAAFLRAFLPGLAPGTVTGEGIGAIEIEKGRQGPARFRLTSDLNRLAISLPAVGYTKPAATRGRLEVAGTIGAAPQIESLQLDTPDLAATGTVRLIPGGGIDLLSLTSLRIGAWLDVAVEVKGRGRGRGPDIRIVSGTADLRRLPPIAPEGAAVAAAGDAAGAISVALDRVTVAAGVDLTGFRGTFGQAGGLNGRFSGRVNGQAPLEGQLETINGRPALRLTSSSAGEVLAAAGLFRNARGGSLDMTLLPRPGAGAFDGRVTMLEFRVVGMPVLAELLNAASIVGLVDQLSSSGLYFTKAEAGLTLGGGQIVLRDASAVGPSFGVTLEGVYDVPADRVEMEGVISPLYFVNGIGSILTRSGEGMFGFSYRLVGSARATQVVMNPLSVLVPGVLRNLFRPSPGPVTPGAAGDAGAER